MPSLEHVLRNVDLGLLYIIAEQWGYTVNTENHETILKSLLPAMLDKDKIAEIFNDLQPNARLAIDDLVNNKSRIPWAQFNRKYGPLSEIGAARRDREDIIRNPGSVADSLFLRALIAREFFDSPSGIQEYAYIPDDFLPLLPIREPYPLVFLGHSAKKKECKINLFADDRIIDDVCTLLSFLRQGSSIEQIETIKWTTDQVEKRPTPPYIYRLPDLLKLLISHGLLDHNNQILPETTRVFLESKRNDALASLVKSWLESKDFNELSMLTNLMIEGNWENNAVLARRKCIEFILTIPKNTWWNLRAFIQSIKEAYPDFQRPAGDYDSWFIRNPITNEYLRGYENWDQVDGVLIKFIICGPLHWLGIVDLASPSIDEPVNAFKLSDWGEYLLKGEPPIGLMEENESIIVRSDATVHIPRLAPRTARYQISRFCKWEGEAKDVYHFQIDGKSLELARSQGLHTNQLLGILRKYAQPIPPSMIKALQTWEKNGNAAALSRVSILQVRNPKIISTLRKSKASRYLDEPISQTTICIKPGSQDKILAILAELGYIGEIKMDE